MTNSDGESYDKTHADATPGHGLGDNAQEAKDTSYSPASEEETEQKQQDPVPDELDDDVEDNVEVAPGTGGPDDQGDVDVDPDDINLPTETS